MYGIDAVDYYVQVYGVVCSFVGITTINRVKMAEPIEMPFGCRFALAQGAFIRRVPDFLCQGQIRWFTPPTMRLLRAILF